MAEELKTVTIESFARKVHGDGGDDFVDGFIGSGGSSGERIGGLPIGRGIRVYGEIRNAHLVGHAAQDVIAPGLRIANEPESRDGRDGTREQVIQDAGL